MRLFVCRICTTAERKLESKMQTFQKSPVVLAIIARAKQFKEDSSGQGQNRDRSKILDMLAQGGKTLDDVLNALVPLEAVARVNQKGVMVIVGACEWMLTGNSRGFYKSFAVVVAACMLSAQEKIEFSAIHHLCGHSGLISPNSVQGVSRARLMRFLGRAGTNKTISSQVSAFTGKSAVFGALGATLKTGEHEFTLTASARRTPLVLAFAAAMESMTDGAFRMLDEDKKISE